METEPLSGLILGLHWDVCMISLESVDALTWELEQLQRSLQLCFREDEVETIDKIF